MIGFLWGAGAVLALSFVVCMFDRDTRRDLGEIVGCVLFLPAYPLVVLALWLARKVNRGRIYRATPRSLRRLVHLVEARGYVIDRPGRTVLVFTKAEGTDR
ncbi:hypothetical protein ABZ863_01745 [Saccharomonospora sp. NPDC046836]|uniref:hypothetical protein n=1 Tax=Saccharomonospora sp. NPDC046836 TaxID=3156921 RepID=UPI0033F857D1